MNLHRWFLFAGVCAAATMSGRMIAATHRRMIRAKTIRERATNGKTMHVRVMTGETIAERTIDTRGEMTAERTRTSATW